MNTDENLKTANQNNSTLPTLVQCQKCGMPLCLSCRSKLEAETIGVPEGPSDESKNVHFYHNREECRILQNVGIKNLRIKSVKDVKQIFAVLTPLRLLQIAKTNPKLLEQEVCNNIDH